MSKALKSIAYLSAITAALDSDYAACFPKEKQKERTIRKCADPKKKTKRKAKQESQRKNRK